MEANWVGVYRETVEPLYRFVARRAGGSRELAQDVVQEAYLRLMDRFASAQPPRSPGAWLTTVARNLLSNHFRALRPVPLDPADLDRLAEAPRPGSVDEAAALDHSLHRLALRERAVIEAFHLDGRSVREIAADLGVSERAVEGRLLRARKKLRRRLERASRREDEDA